MNIEIIDFKMDSLEISQSTKNIEELHKAISNYSGCHEIRAHAKNPVFGSGNASSPLVLFIGEAPGVNEDANAVPFCGRSGLLLRDGITKSGLKDDDFYITNTVFWRPPNNRKPTSKEIAECRPFLERIISFINPKIIILLGKTAAESLLKFDKSVSMSSLYGKSFMYKNDFSNKTIDSYVLYHPAFILRNINNKSAFFENLKSIVQNHIN